MSRLKVTLVNNFHNTQCNVIINYNEQTKTFRLTQSQDNRINNALCGMKDCDCGTIRGKCYITNTGENFRFEVISSNGLMKRL